jgi:hypothetical protein
MSNGRTVGLANAVPTRVGFWPPPELARTARIHGSNVRHAAVGQPPQQLRARVDLPFASADLQAAANLVPLVARVHHGRNCTQVRIASCRIASSAVDGRMRSAREKQRGRPPPSDPHSLTLISTAIPRHAQSSINANIPSPLAVPSPCAVWATRTRAAINGPFHFVMALDSVSNTCSSRRRPSNDMRLPSPVTPTMLISPISSIAPETCSRGRTSWAKAMSSMLLLASRCIECTALADGLLLLLGNAPPHHGLPWELSRGASTLRLLSARAATSTTPLEPLPSATGSCGAAATRY